MKKHNVWKWINRIVSTVLMVLLISVAAIVVFTKLSEEDPEVFGHQLKAVLSGSMEPGIQTGSMIAVRSVDDERTDFKSGDVITFIEEDNTLITHRIVEVTTTNNGVLYTTKGDNNNAVDANPVLADNVVGVYNGFTIPYIGYFINFAQSPEGSALLLILPGIFLFGYSIFTIWRTLNTLEKKQNVEAK
ncbi:signal peptidase I [Virgibacillus sp. NKC19-3]|uniref:signal peptidase I SipW n=1 Tax=Virgibacillus saliphilus TaxID=2831674 RepID=UPI001C9A7B2F|nr:signal peptidase I [Virgibacillus sp. NKC19-3]MBY7144126.1 signal peptidase I [Virgibacillus sp. NKC19-3]